MFRKGRSSQIKILALICLLSFLPIGPIQAEAPAPAWLDTLTSALEGPHTRNQEPEYLTYDELVSLSANPRPGGLLGEKLEKFWRTPLINNEAYYRGVQPHKPSSEKLGPFLRVVSWNIEKSLNIDRAILLLTVTSQAFDRMIDPDIKRDSKEYKKIVRQRERLLSADIIVLQEMEIGIKRSKYWNAPAKLAEALDMNYAYGPQYLEIDPVILGTESIKLEDGEIDQEAMDYYAVDHSQYKGVFGSAVLSRYPIKNVEVRPLETQPYDWYEGEMQKIGFLEQARRLGTKTMFKNELTREIKVGGRNYFRVDLDVPDLEEKTLSVINIHLEIKCQPQDRDAQMQEILSAIHGIKNPVIMLGDYNAAPTDISPTSVTRVVSRTAKNPTTWLNLAVNYVSPYGLAINTTRGASNITKNFNDPFASDVKVVAPNPLKMMFTRIQNFRFVDKRVFDFRGDPERSINGKDKLLANSNQRGLKGFITTFRVVRPWGIVGKYRLDWVFVKSYLYKPENPEGPYQFAPHFGETLEEMNTGLVEQISDHHPNVVDLPFEEPRI